MIGLIISVAFLTVSIILLLQSRKVTKDVNEIQEIANSMLNDSKKDLNELLALKQKLAARLKT